MVIKRCSVTGHTEHTPTDGLTLLWFSGQLLVILLRFKAVELKLKVSHQLEAIHAL